MDTKKIVAAVVLGIAAVAVVAFASPRLAPSASQPAALAQNPLPAKGITVTGQGEVTAKPDMAMIRLGVQTQAETAEQAQQVNAQKMDAIINTVKRLGIADKDLQTSTISIRPVYRSERMPNGESTIVGYEASNIVSVRITDLSKVGPLLDQAVANGANTARGIQFGMQDDSALRREALKKAVDDARVKAEAIAEAAGRNITGIESVTEESFSFPTVRQAMDTFAVAEGASTPVEPGELEIIANVRVVYGF